MAKLGAVLVMTFLMFLPSLQGTFLFDDKAIVQSNSHIQGLSKIPRLLMLNYWAGTAYEREVLLYRPLVMASFAVDHAVWKGRPLGFHLMNVLWHVWVTALVYAVGWGWFRHRGAALLAAAAFGLHTIHTEAVNMIVARTELMSAAGALGAVWLWRRGQKGWAMVSLVAGMLSKETAAVTPLLVMIMSRRDSAARGARSTGGAGGADPNWKGWFSAGRSTVGLWGAVALCLGVRTVVLGGLVSTGQTGIFSLHPPEVRWLTALTALSKYAGLLVVPLNLSPDYPDYRLAFSWSDVRVWGTVLWLGTLGAGVWKFRNVWPSGWLGAAWWFMALLPVSNLLLPIGGVVGERFLYLPSVGVCWWLGSLACETPLAWRKATMMAAWVLIIGWGGLTWARNGEWKNDETLWGAALVDHPTNTKAAYHMADLAMRRKEYAAAEILFQRALEVDPARAWNPDRRSRADVFWKLGQIRQYQGRLAEAKTAYEEAVVLVPAFGQARYAAALVGGLMAAQAGEFRKAIEGYRRALTIQETAEGYYNMSVSWLKLGNYQEAMKSCDAALKLDSAYVLAHINRGNALTYLGRYSEAASAYEEALRRDPGSEMARKNLETVRSQLP